MINYRILIDGVDYTSYCSLPFKEQYVLDSALDNGVLTLPMTNISTIFKPFTLVTITKDSDTYNMVVASDKMTEIVGTGKYTHELVLIEETKLLEKKVVDTNTTTQPLYVDYLAHAPMALVECIGTLGANSGEYYSSYYKSAYYNTSTLITQSLADHFAETNNPNSQTLIIAFARLRIYFNGTQIEHTNSYTQTYTLNLSDYGNGELKLEYYTDINNQYNATDTIIINIIDYIAPKTKKTITDVVNRLLAITETLRANDTPSLVFNQEQANFYNQAKETWLINDSPNVTNNLNVDIKFISNNTKYSNISTGSANLYYDNISMYYSIGDSWRDNAYKIVQFLERPTGDLLTWLQANATKQSEELYYPAPEFSMTKSTLRECLDQVGSYIHSIVRLVGNVIYFDKLGGTTQTELDREYIGNYETLDCEQYASQLDSIVSNITNIDDSQTGTISEPFPVAYKTVRAETGNIRIDDESAIIETDYPIEKIEKLVFYIEVN